MYRLGEEIALDINSLEKQIKHSGNENNYLTSDRKASSVAKSFASLQEESHLSDEKIMQFLRDQFQKLDDRKANIEDF